jgi:RHS repeat-associated protein
MSFMLASQAIDYVGPNTILSTMFPQASFGFNVTPAFSSPSTISTPVTQNSGTPLPPGKVTYENTWNNTGTAPCPVSNSPSQTLAQVSSNESTLKALVPTAIFMDQPAGSSVNQTFNTFSNGTTIVSDNEGNSFGWTITGLPTGLVTTKTIANSTEIIQNTTVATAIATIASIEVTYSIAYKSCTESGVRTTIQGNVVWGAAKTGIISVSFTKKPISINGTTAYFGNSSGAALGYNWSDSESLSPVYSSVTNSLSFTVGSTFNIDPSTVYTFSYSGYSYDITTQSSQQKTLFANGLYWVFLYCEVGASFGLCDFSSKNGTTWSSPTLLSTSLGCYGCFGIANSGNTVYYVIANGVTNFDWRYGTLNSGGTITWSISETSVTTPYDFSYPTAYVDGSGNFYVSGTEANSTWYADVYKYNSSGWNLAHAFGTGAGARSWPYSQVTGSSSGIAMVYGIPSLSNTYVSTSTNAGVSWSASVATAKEFDMSASEVTMSGNTVFLAGSNSDDLYFTKFTLGGSGWSALYEIESGYEPCSAGMASDSSQNLEIFESCNSVQVNTVSSLNGGNSWGVLNSISTGHPDSITMSPTVVNNMAFGLWTYFSGGTNYVEFQAVPVIIPDAATSSNPSSLPGLSPYEDYFSHLSEYVSPGNGLLGVEQTDLTVTGRALDLSLTRVYSQPYAFTSSNSSYGYDNYTFANMGLGWELNFPWMGADYLHLFDGQIFAYNWTNSVFEDHSGADFRLVNNSGSSYDLYLSSGVDYHFDSSKRLVSITDPTGNNTIHFSYNGNNEISSINDTIGRLITFTYSGTLVSSISTEEGKFNYTYSGSNLISVSDPLGRTTKFYYKSSSNPWLLTSLTYPTGGYSNYTYGSASAGLSVKTYYVTSQNIYAGLHSLSRSTAFSYFIINGQVQTTNTNISDGSTVRERVNYVFDISNQRTRTEENGSGSTILQYQDNFDNNGRIIESEVLSPSGTLLAYSQSRYDNWSNVIYTRDQIGQQTWFSYSNTNTSNNFYTNKTQVNSFSGFYTNNTISSNIHDLLLGEAQFQNGNGTNKVETYYDYNSAGELIHEKQLHNGNSLVSSNTYDSYGNKLTSTDPLGRTTYYQYSSTYSHAYLTQTSILVGGTGGSTTPFGLDGNTSAAAGSTAVSSLSAKLTTTHPDVIVVSSESAGSSSYPSVTSITDTAGLTWHSRKVYQVHGIGSATDYFDTEEWYAYSSSALTADTITVHISASTKKFAINIFGISGANTGSPFDPNSGLAATADGTSSSPSVSVSTNNANDIILGLFMENGALSFSHGTGFTTIASNSSSGTLTTMYSEYQIVSTAQSSLSVSASFSASRAWMVIGDAIEKNPNLHNITSSYTYNSTTGWELSMTDGEGNTTYYAYDKIGRLTTTTYPLIHGQTQVQTNAYNDASNTLTITDERGNITKQYFDGLGRLNETARFSSPTNSTPYSKETFQNNWLDQVANETNEIGSTYKYSYDAEGRQIKATNPDNSTITTTYNDTANTKTVVDENGNKVIYGYDWNSRLIWVKEYNTSTNYYFTNYTYDLSGNLLSQKDAKSNTTSYTYDDLNRLIQTNYPGGTSQTQSYDSVGNLIGKDDPDGHIINYTYDALNRLISVKYPDGSQVIYTYDNNGNRLEMNSSASIVYYRYDARNRLINETDVMSGTAYTTLYYYDKTSNIVALDYPGGSNTTFTYDAFDRVLKVGSYATFTYTKDDHIATITYGNSIVTTYTYDSRSRPKQILSKSGSTTVQSLSYTYDGADNVKSLVTSSNTYNYTYDALNRLTYSSGPGGAANYTYDSTGNIVKTIIGGSATTYSIGSSNRLTAMNGTATAFSYDNNGNLLTATTGSTTLHFHYDFENRLTSEVQNTNTVLQNNTFDGDGRRIKLTNSSGSIVYAYQGQNIIYEKNLNTGIVVYHYYANGIQVGKSVTGTPYYYLPDNLGSTRLVTNSAGGTVFSTNYTPYGTTSGSSGSEEFTFTGKLFDSATGLYYYGARFYYPKYYRFITEDSTTGILQDPLSQNRYMYARDNPLSSVDPTGQLGAPPPNYMQHNNAQGSDPISNALNSCASAVSNWWNGLPPGTKQAIVITAAVVAVAAVTVATCGVGGVPAAAAISASLSVGSYTVSSGDQATGLGAVEAAGFGAAAGAAGAGIGDLFGEAGTAAAKLALGHALAAAAAASLDAAQSVVTGLISGKAPSFDYGKMSIDAGFAAVGFHLSLKSIVWEAPDNIVNTKIIDLQPVDTSFEESNGLVAHYLVPAVGSTITSFLPTIEYLLRYAQ